MSIDYTFFDLREERYSALYRVWLIAHILSANRNGKLQLSIYKAQQIDYIVKNPQLFKRACQFLSGAQSAVNISEALYNSEINKSKTFDKQDFLAKVMQLCSGGVIEIAKEDGVFFIKCLMSPPAPEISAQIHLESQIVAVKGLVQRAELVLNKIILGE
ncbi:hypothetical protein [Pseudomonas moraviensis]|uniref:hypothetical protein n=1 Tax=Pseudomonas moraviensis TaxID=321662 RepID=UPI001059BB64|nr:hypothetical protein [Pseudomonas moraviensis]TDK53840.1 hypothetical protein E1508_16555 [Pseudomonas moraviensis]